MPQIYQPQPIHLPSNGFTNVAQSPQVPLPSPSSSSQGTFAFIPPTSYNGHPIPIVIHTPQNNSTSYRRSDFKPTTDDQKLVAGLADASPTALEALRDPEEPSIAAWKAAVYSSPATIAKGIPKAAIQFQLCDSVTHRETRSQIDQNIVVPLKTDLVAREQAVTAKTLLLCNGQRLPEKLHKKLLATVLCVRAEHFPSLAEIAKAQDITDTFGNVVKGKGIGYGQAATLLAEALRSAWPEFSWNPFDLLVNIIRQFTDIAANLSHSQSMREAALKLSASMWADGLRKLQSGFDAIRLADELPDDLTSLPVCGKDFESWVLKEQSEFNKNLSLFAALTANNDSSSSAGGGNGGGASSSSLAEGSLNRALSSWQAEFPNVCLFAHCSPRGCNRGDKCPHASTHNDTLDADKVKAFKAKHGLQ